MKVFFRPTMLALGLMMSAAVANPALAQDTERPLLVEGKNTVYQRVLTRAAVDALDGPDGGTVDNLYAFSPLYVYARAGDWLNLGKTERGANFWLPVSAVVDWKHNIVAAFNAPVNRNRQLMFEDQAGLQDFLHNSENLVALQPILLEEADTDRLRPEIGIVSVEPLQFVEISQQFYIMPILSFVRDLHPLSVNDNLLLNVASIPLNTDPPETSDMQEFDAGIVFVFDTTQSMETYLDRSITLLSQMVSDAAGSEVGNRIHFGAIGFRDNPDASDGLGYRIKEIISLERRDNNAAVIDAIAATDVATVSSPGFNEDSIEGLRYALHETDWDQDGKSFGGRYIVLVTDAGPKAPGDPNAATDTDPNALRVAAQDKGVAILTMHLTTVAGGEGNHAYARNAYSELSTFDGITYYYNIEGGDPAAFQREGTNTLNAIIDHIRVAMGEDAQQSDADRPEGMDSLGPAMRTRWLGRRDSTQAPDIITSWVSTLAAESGIRFAFEPRLLVTKNELATMATLVSEFITLGENVQSYEDSQVFFAQMQQTVMRAIEDPQRLQQIPDAGLEDALEYLVDLPYRSQILQFDADVWGDDTAGRRQILDSLRPRLAQYRSWLDDQSVWTELYEGSQPGDTVFAMPFEMLP